MCDDAGAVVTCTTLRDAHTTNGDSNSSNSNDDNEDDYALPTTFDYYTERYFHHYVVRDCKGVAGNHCRLLLHSNGLCVVCLDTTHAAVLATRGRRRCRSDDGNAKSGADAEVVVTSVTFGSSRRQRQQAASAATTTTTTAAVGASPTVIGKRKRNAQRCYADTRLCTVQLSSGASYAIPACVSGLLLEYNAQLLQQPALVVRAPLQDGYVAVLQPSLQQDWSAFARVWTATAGETTLADDDDDGDDGDNATVVATADA